MICNGRGIPGWKKTKEETKYSETVFIESSFSYQLIIVSSFRSEQESLSQVESRIKPVLATYDNKIETKATTKNNNILFHNFMLLQKSY